MKRTGAALPLACLCGCATTEVIVSAPPEFWMTAERIALALWEDLVSIVGFLL